MNKVNYTLYYYYHSLMLEGEYIYILDLLNERQVQYRIVTYLVHRMNDAPFDEPSELLTPLKVVIQFFDLRYEQDVFIMF